MVKECKGCTRIIDNKCIAISDPIGMWAEGQCWAYTADPNWYKKYMRDLKKYRGVK